MRLLIALALCAIIIAPALAQCEASTADADEYETIYKVVGEDAVFTTIIRIPLEPECLTTLGLDALRQGPITCAQDLTEQLYDPVYKGTGQLPSDASCTIEYMDLHTMSDPGGGEFKVEHDHHLHIQGSGTIVMFVKAEGDRHIIEFTKWDYKPVNASDTLTIELPRDTDKVDYVPHANSTLNSSTIYWSLFPAETPRIVYTLKTDYTPFFLAIGLLACGAAALFYFFTQVRKDKLDKREAEIKEAMKQAQYQYMKRQVDEAMFRSLMEKYMSELNDIQTKKRMLKPKTNLEEIKV